MEQAILDDRNYEPKKEDFIDKIPETIPEGNGCLNPTLRQLHDPPFSFQRMNP